jgi:hypothetical protein
MSKTERDWGGARLCPIEKAVSLSDSPDLAGWLAGAGL